MGKPNFSEVEAVLAALERAERALITGSGMAAFATVFETFLPSGSHVIAPIALYLGTEQLLRRWEKHRGLRITWVQNTLDLMEWEAKIEKNTALILTETPSNPTLAITDLASIAALGQKHGVRTLADNTFASPVLTRPCDLGIDLSVSSATKYLGGHSDLVLGVIAGGRRTWWPVGRL